MNCQQARRFLYAFADGELTVKDNCEVLDHLKMCPGCARIASDQQALRGSLQRMIDRTAAPGDLVDQIRARLPQSAASASRAAGWGRSWARAFGPLGLAACILIGVGLAWNSWGPAVSTPGVPIRNVGQVDQAAARVVSVHESCLTHTASEHQNKDLPSELSGLADTMSAHFKNTLHVLAPDLSRGGYRFESANFCGVRPKCGGTHIVYVSADGRSRVSFFSAPRWSCLDRCADNRKLGDRDCRRFSVPQEGSQFAVVAWHDDQTTHVCCGEMPVETLARLVEPVRVATVQAQDRWAALWPVDWRP